MLLILVSSILFLNGSFMNGEEINNSLFQTNESSRLPIIGEIQRYQKEVDFQELYSFIAKRMNASMDTLRFYPVLQVFSENFQDEISFTESLHLYRPRILSKKEQFTTMSLQERFYRKSSIVKAYSRSGPFNLSKYHKLRKNYDCVGDIFICNDKGKYLKTFSLWENLFIHPSWGRQIWNLDDYPKVEYLLLFDCWDFFLICSDESHVEILDEELYHQFVRIPWDEFYRVVKKYRGDRIGIPITDLVRKYPEENEKPLQRICNH